MVNTKIFVNLLILHLTFSDSNRNVLSVLIMLESLEHAHMPKCFQTFPSYVPSTLSEEVNSWSQGFMLPMK